MAVAKKKPGKTELAEQASLSKKKTDSGKATGVESEHLTAFLSKLNKAGVRGDLTKKVEFLSTGDWILDRLIGDGTGTGAPGGVPRGQIVEIFGDESCGKTTLALAIAKGVQDAGGLVVYVDHERSLAAQNLYVQKLGINIHDPKKWILIEPDNYEQGNSLMCEAILKLKPALVVVDSLAAAVPRDAMESDPGDPVRMGLHASITAQILARMPKFLKIGNSALVILNQLRVRIKKDKFDHGPDEQTTGGNAIKFYMAVRIEMKKGRQEKLEGISNLTGAKEYKVLNQTVKVVILKNKIDIPFRSSPIYITFGKGIDGLRSLIELGMNKKVIQGEGWYYYESTTNKECSWKKQGMQATYKFLSENPAIVQDMLPRLLPSVDSAEMREAMESGLVEAGEVSVEDFAKLATQGEELDEESLALLEEMNEAQGTAGKKPKEVKNG